MASATVRSGLRPLRRRHRRRPHDVWRRLRDEAPLYYNEQYDFYALSRFADVMAASLDWQTYSSARGTVLEIIDTTPPAPDAVRPATATG